MSISDLEYHHLQNFSLDYFVYVVIVSSTSYCEKWNTKSRDFSRFIKRFEKNTKNQLIENTHKISQAWEKKKTFVKNHCDEIELKIGKFLLSWCWHVPIIIIIIFVIEGSRYSQSSENQFFIYCRFQWNEQCN